MITVPGRTTWFGIKPVLEVGSCDDDQDPAEDGCNRRLEGQTEDEPGRATQYDRPSENEQETRRPWDCREQRLMEWRVCREPIGEWADGRPGQEPGEHC